MRKPSCLRTALAPPSQPTRYFERISKLSPPVVLMRLTTPSPSCAKDSNSQPNFTATFGIASATDFNSGSRVYCEMI